VAENAYLVEAGRKRPVRRETASLLCPRLGVRKEVA